MGVKHSYQSATANDPEKEVSSARWNQDHRIDGVIALLQPSSSFTAGVAVGTLWTTTGTKSTPGRSAASALAAMQRSVYTTGAASGNAAGEYSADLVWRGSAENLGGFRFFGRIGVITYLSDMQIMCGVSAGAFSLSGEPSARNDTIALGKDSGDTNWQLIFRSNSETTKVDLGLAVSAGQILQVSIDAEPNASSVTVRVERVDDAAVLADNTVHSANLPRDTIMMCAHIQCRTTQAAACAVANNIISVAPGRV